MPRVKLPPPSSTKTTREVDLADLERLYSTSRSVELRLEEVLRECSLSEDVRSRLAGAMIGSAQIAQFASGLWFNHPIPCPAFRQDPQFPKPVEPKPKKR